MKFFAKSPAHTTEREREREKGKRISLVMLAQCKHESRIMREDFASRRRENQAKYIHTRCTKSHQIMLIFIDVCDVKP